MKNKILDEYIKNMNQYIEYKRALSYKYGVREVKELNKMISYLFEMCPDKVEISKETVNRYIYSNSNLSSSTVSAKESRITLFGRFLITKGYSDISVPLSHKTKVSTDFVPYIFSREEILDIFKATDQLPDYYFDRNNRLFYQVFIRLLYSTGIRLGEGISLKVEDVNLNYGILTIHDGKGRTSRLVPYDESLKLWMNAWAKKALDTKSVYFFETSKKTKRNRSTIYKHFEKDILVIAGIKRNSTNTGPRLHDLRHTFACHTLAEMEKNGIDTYTALPYLSVYMGHVDIKSTEKYLRLAYHEYNQLTERSQWILEDVFGDKDEK